MNHWMTVEMASLSVCTRASYRIQLIRDTLERTAQPNAHVSHFGLSCSNTLVLGEIFIDFTGCSLRVHGPRRQRISVFSRFASVER